MFELVNGVETVEKVWWCGGVVVWWCGRCYGAPLSGKKGTFTPPPTSPSLPSSLNSLPSLLPLPPLPPSLPRRETATRKILIPRLPKERCTGEGGGQTH
ncbi:hypothetical protein E2C01_097782 [Portunus trituberculatus]|uniref:Uncharacterized protein n=1 Tax=Portunus trituberculatus TaxID=210409 RepID=A0A5B7KCA0_PORTR|nr:hypothetical protein [Portunus trituberculatus]